jgi:hypothetical protein
MEIEMTDIVSGEKAAEPPTLAVTLLTQFSALDSNRNNLPKRRGSHLKSTSIAKTLLSFRNKFVTKKNKSKAESDAKILEYIAEENMNHNQLFIEVWSLKQCCQKGKTTAKTNSDCINCILRYFIKDDTKKTLQFVEQCNFVRR